MPDDTTGKIAPSNPAYKVQYILSLVLEAPMGDLYRYEEVNESVINWAQAAFGSHHQMYLLMEQIGRPCAEPSEAQQSEGNLLAEALPSWPQEGSVTVQDGYLLVCF